MITTNLLFATMVGAAAAASPLSLLEGGSHCVAYKAEKTTLLFISSGEVVGKNCDIAAQILPEVGGLFHIEVNIPVRSFQSGSEERDEDVAKSLKANERAEMTFRSKPLTPEKWRELFAKSRFDLDGELQIGEKSYPLKIASQYISGAEGDEVDGYAKVKFSDFGLTPPKVIGGVITKSKPEFELHFHLVASRILGADAIRLEKK